MAAVRRPLLCALASLALALLAASGASAAAQARLGHRRHAAACAQARHRRARHHVRRRRGGAARCAWPGSRARKRAKHALHARPQTHAATAPASAANGSGGCEGATLIPTEANLAQVTAATFCLINRERGAHGEQPLRADEDLMRAALGHSESMATAGYFEHDGPGGQTPLGRVQTSGYLHGDEGGYEIGENIAWGSLGEATPASIVAAWMASPGHRANILNARFRDSGIGVAAQLPAAFADGEAGAIYTQDFGVILTAG